MFKSLVLAGAAAATLVAAPASARDYRYDGYRHHRGNGDALAGALIGAVAGAALASSVNRSYGYSNYGYGYPAYGYDYPSYGYGYGYPAYGYAVPSYGYGYGYPAYGYSYPRSGVSISIGTGYGGRYRGW